MLWPVAYLILRTLAPAPLGEDRGRLLRPRTEGIGRPEKVCVGGHLQRRLSRPLPRSSGPNAPASQDSAQKSVSADARSPVKHGLRPSRDVCFAWDTLPGASASCVVVKAQAGPPKPLKTSV